MHTATSDAFINLHNALYSRFRKYNLNLDAYTDRESVSGATRSFGTLVMYARSSSEAQVIERVMGRDIPAHRVDHRCHPAIELRLDSAWLVLELVVPPQAWVDQQNLIGKLSIDRQRREFRKLIARLNPAFRLGFWQGGHLDEMHLTAQHLAHPGVFEQWMTTYNDSQDWFRVGMWYPAEKLNEGDVAVELFNCAQELYSLYTFIAWHSNNDFRSFYLRDVQMSFA